MFVVCVSRETFLVFSNHKIWSYIESLRSFNKQMNYMIRSRH